MFNHAPAEYICPICLGVQGIENKDTLLLQTDLIHKNDDVSVFMNSFFIKGNEGHVIIVPNKHYENIYDLPVDIGAVIFSFARQMAEILKKAYGCDGITIAQNNEPAGGQHAFHYHMHVFPRFMNDSFFENSKHKLSTTPEVRLPYTQKIKAVLTTVNDR